MAPTIEFEGVGFSYEEGPGVLDSTDLRIVAGERVALVGTTGIGKSTIANLILGFYAPERGVVRVGGVDVADLDLGFLRESIAYVDQENFLFDTTIGENIAIGRPGASPEAILEAARAARIDEFIDRQPAGLDTRVGTRGMCLSMGQRQRIAIARALLRDAPILILDEYTSNVDPETEREIRAGLRELTRGRTTLVITHRPSTLVDVDRVLRLKPDGRIVDLGRPETVEAGSKINEPFHSQAVLTTSVVAQGGR